LSWLKETENNDLTDALLATIVFFLIFLLVILVL